MDSYILVSNKKWHINLFEKLNKTNFKQKWILIDNKKDFNIENIDSINPKSIFIPHWSFYIPDKIFQNYNCIVFHMTDLPYGRGGSPLQNLIVNCHKNTKISALKVVKGIDEGPIYIKKNLNLKGSAKEIFLRSSDKIFEMICLIIDKNLIPIPQKGTPVLFKRRTPEQSDISKLDDLNLIYDYIRMLDCEGYPHAYMELNGLKFEFTNVKKNKNNLKANVKITKC
jgi:methionyl-tRNA formyltransferase